LLAKVVSKVSVVDNCNLHHVVNCLGRLNFISNIFQFLFYICTYIN